MRITEIYVERLKSYGDYSNRRIGLKAIIDEGEDLKEAYMDLARKCEELLDIQQIEAKTTEVEYFIKRYEERKKELEQLKEEYCEIREELNEELNGLRRELERIERLAEEKHLKLKDEILEKLRKIRNAISLGFYNP